MDDKSIRDGLIHAMASQRDRTAPSSGCEPTLDSLLLGQEPTEGVGDEHRKGQALECALFSSIAIGGLMLGCPVRDVARHLVSAQRCREQLDGLRDRSAVAALLLHAVSHAFLGAAQVRPTKADASATLRERQSTLQTNAIYLACACR